MEKLEEYDEQGSIFTQFEIRTDPVKWQKETKVGIFVSNFFAYF